MSSAPCAHCARERRIHARGLCDPCYQGLAGYGGTGRKRQPADPMFSLYPPVRRKRADLLEDLQVVLADGATNAGAAQRLGISTSYVRRLRRAL